MTEIHESMTLHQYGAKSEIRGIQSKLHELGLKGNVAVKNEQTHIFFTEPVSPIAPQWTLCWGCEFCEHIPHKRLKYSVYPPLILLPTGSADVSKITAREILAKHHDCTHVAVNRQISVGDRIRRPHLESLIGELGPFLSSDTPSDQDFERAFWASSVQNGIHQYWAPMYTMFSRGNVTEKKRVKNTFNYQNSIANSTVIDLYSGIGYFTFPYATQRPKRIYCWEINWWSVQGMLRGAVSNGFPCRAVFPGQKYDPLPEDFIVIFVEDNQNASQRTTELDLRHISHINMGLLPHARDAIPVALALAAESGPDHPRPVIHLHENVHEAELGAWTRDMGDQLGREAVHVEKIKQFAPHVFHVCGDFA